jgi:type II secretory pathway component GspD/PulD (secretin)
MFEKSILGSNKAVRACVALFVLLWALFVPCAKAQVSQASAVGGSGGGVSSGELTKNASSGSVLPSPGNVTVNFKDVEIKTVLHYLSEVSGIDIIPAPGVDGKVTMRLRDKSWETALDIVTRNYGYVYSVEGEIIRVMPRGQLAAEETVTEVIRLNNLTREVELLRASQSASDEVAVTRTEVSIQQLMRAVNALLDARRGEGATFIQSVNSIVVTAIPTKMGEIKRIVSAIDQRPAQIVLDAKVVEITLRKDERFGIDWNTVISAAGARRPITFPFNNQGVIPWLPGSQRDNYAMGGHTGATIGNPNVPMDIPAIDIETLVDPMEAATPDALFSFGTLDFSTFTATLQLLDQRGDTEILSSPRITTLNNQKAAIKVIDKIMLQKSVETTQTAALVTVEFEKESDAREVGVKLTVLPHVNDKGEISVNLLPEVSSDPVFDELGIGAAANTIALTYSSREANTVVRVNDGETIFLGGLIRKNSIVTENKFPILGDMFGGIPVVGNIFKYEAENVSRTEIVFFVTVHLVKDTIDSVDFSRTRGFYDRYISGIGDDAPLEEIMSSGEGAVPVIHKGKLKVSEKEITLELPKDGAVEKKKAFLDFRKKD